MSLINYYSLVVILLLSVSFFHSRCYLDLLPDNTSQSSVVNDVSILMTKDVIARGWLCIHNSYHLLSLRSHSICNHIIQLSYISYCTYSFYSTFVMMLL
jgi:hypothetical protein